MWAAHLCAISRVDPRTNRVVAKVPLPPVRLGCWDVLGAVEVGLQTCPLGLAGGAEGAEEGRGLLGVLGPDRTVAGVVGSLRAAGRVAHPRQRLGRGRGAGQLEAQRSGGVAEPAVVGDPKVQGVGALAQQVENLAVAALDLRRVAGGGRRRASRAERGVHAGEELDEFAGAGPGGQDALLVVAELSEGQLQVALPLVPVDLVGQQLGLGAAGAS